MTDHRTDLPAHSRPGYRTIVVGCNGSTQADDAVALAQQLLAPEHARLVLANVFPFHRGCELSATPSMYATVLQSEAVATLEAASARIDARISRALVPVSDSSVARGITDVARAEHADLIVLGSTHRHAGGRLSGLGVVGRLVHGAPCAVAVAASDQRLRAGGLCSIGVAYDGSDEARAALDVAYGLAVRHAATVQVCRVAEIVEFASSYIVTDDDLQSREELEARAEEEVNEAVAAAPDGVSATGDVVIGRAAQAIREACSGVDLIICGSRSYGPIHSVLLGSTSMGLVSHGDVPVLVLPRGRAIAPPPAVGVLSATGER